MEAEYVVMFMLTMRDHEDVSRLIRGVLKKQKKIT